MVSYFYHRAHMRNLFICGCLIIGLCELSSAAEATPVANATRLTIKPTLDGDVLGDGAWSKVIPATNFWQTRPFEGEPATQRTEVFVGFTDDALFIAVVCYDDHPEKIIVTDSRRDSSLEETDSFQVILDAFQDRQNGFVFGTNPVGIEYDGQVIKEAGNRFGSGGGGFNLNWDTSWSVKSVISDLGWSAEMEIPFKSLRYGKEEMQSWGINFQRNIRRNNEVVYWSPLPRQYNLHRVSLAGTLNGLSLPKQRNLKITPYALGIAARGGNLPDGTHFEEEFGFDIKYSVTPSLTLDATYNTDFAQVEVDEVQVNLDRFSLFFPEKRPFFLENAGQFSVGTPQEVELFFSRRIGVGDGGAQLPIDGGLRLSGKIGDSTNIGLLQMRSEAVPGSAPENDFTVVRVNQELANRSSIGGIFVQRDGDGSLSSDESSDYNRTYAIDGRWGIGEKILIEGYVAETETPGRRGDDAAYRLRGRYQSQRWNNSLSYTKVGANFNPEVGFLTRNNYEKVDFLVFHTIRPKDLWGLHELRPHVAYRGFWDDEGFYETGFIHVDNHWEWPSGFEVHTGINFTHQGVKSAFEINTGTFVEPGEYDHEEVALVLITDRSKPLSLESRATIGGFFGGDRVSLSATVNYRVGEAFTSAFTWNYNDIDLPVMNGDFEVNVGRFRATYSFTPKVQLQALVQYDDRTDLIATNIRFAWLQSANAGLYLVYNEIDDDTFVGPIEKRREFVIKYSRIVDLL